MQLLCAVQPFSLRLSESKKQEVSRHRGRACRIASRFMLLVSLSSGIHWPAEKAAW